MHQYPEICQNNLPKVNVMEISPVVLKFDFKNRIAIRNAGLVMVVKERPKGHQKTSDLSTEDNEVHNRFCGGHLFLI